ncbi:hypothetical protein D3C73_1530930 [compost metagenome]
MVDRLGTPAESTFQESYLTLRLPPTRSRWFHIASLPEVGIGNGTPGNRLSMDKPPLMDWVPVAFFTLLSSTACGRATVRWVGYTLMW